MSKNIVLTVDYHDQNCVIRRRDEATGREQVLTVPTAPQALRALADQAWAEATPRGGRVVWLQESTTGWARVQALLGERSDFRLVNVLQLPRAPKDRRRKTDKLDTARVQREYRNGSLRWSYQPSAEQRAVRRLVAYREDLVNRRTALSNWINRYLAHETWWSRSGLSSAKGRAQLRADAHRLPRTDELIVAAKLDEIGRLNEQLRSVAGELLQVFKACAQAQQLDAIRGISVLGAVSMVARIGPIARFANAAQLIAFAGLAPGVRQSDQTRREGRIGGGGTDARLRHYVIEATIWARQLPRYRPTYERVQRRRGNKIARLTVARLLLRSVYKMLRDGVAFQPEATTGR